MTTSERFITGLMTAVLATAMGGCAGPWPAANTAAVFRPAIPPTVTNAQPGPVVATAWAGPRLANATAVNSAVNSASRVDTSAPGARDQWRGPMPVSGAPVARGQNEPIGSGWQPPAGQAGSAIQPVPETVFPGVVVPEQIMPPAVGGVGMGPPPVDFDVHVEEARTGRFMFGVGVNSELGVTGQIVVDERNFDWRRIPTSWQDVVNGTAWRGAGQGFRLEAMPGDQVQRYLVSFTEPYLYLPGIAEPFSLNLSGFYFDRRYYDWSERRLGGRVALGYRVTHDLSLTTSLRAEDVDIRNPRVLGVPELDEVLGENAFYSGRVTLTHDTRDTPFAPTEGHLIELSYEQAFGDFDYPRGDAEYHQYFLVRERPDGSGRHTLGYSFRAGFSGSDTPIFENYFAGGFSTLRGFDFRSASPIDPRTGVIIGGKFRFIGSVEYMFPLTADDMLRGVVFCDYGTTEETIGIHSDLYRVAPGFGLRIAVPAMGPAPLALDLAFPVAKASFDDVQNFSFFLGFTR